MPGYRTHVVGGMCAAVAVMLFCVPAPDVLVGVERLCCACLGSLFPDVDIKSKGQRLFYLGVFAVALYLLLTGNKNGLGIVGILSLVPLVVRHRGIFHSPLFLLLLIGSIMLGSVPTSYGVAVWWDALFFGIGAWSHVLLDLGIIGFCRRLVRGI